VTAVELEAMRNGAREFLRDEPPDALDAELRALTAPEPARNPRNHRMHWKTIEAGHVTCR
jgi:hypothetical protein